MKIDSKIKVFGDKKLRMKKPPSEDAEQVTIFNHLRLHYPELAALACHVKNEGNKSQAQAQKDARMGLCKGFADIVIIGNPVFLCELKKADFTKSRISKEQESFLLAAQNEGSFACVALGHNGFFEALEAWKNA